MLCRCWAQHVHHKRKMSATPFLFPILWLFHMDIYTAEKQESNVQVLFFLVPKWTNSLDFNDLVAFSIVPKWSIFSTTLLANNYSVRPPLEPWWLLAMLGSKHSKVAFKCLTCPFWPEIASHISKNLEKARQTDMCFLLGILTLRANPVHCSCDQRPVYT